MQRVHLAVLLTLVALTAVWVLVDRRPSIATGPAPRPPDLLHIALPSAALVATVDVTALEDTPVGRALLAQAVSVAAREPQACAKRLLAEARRVVVTVPEASTAQGLEAATDVAVLAEGDVLAGEVLACAETLMVARGARPVRTEVGSFSVLRERGAERGGGELAIRDGGPLILSGGAYFRELIERGTAPSAASAAPRAAQHLALRAAVGRAPLVLSWVLPPGWLERWLDDPQVAASPLANIRTIALRAEAADALRVVAIATATDMGAAIRIQRFARRTLDDLATNGDGQGAARWAVAREAERVTLTLNLGRRELDALLGSHAFGSAHPEQSKSEPEGLPGGGAQQEP